MLASFFYPWFSFHFPSKNHTPASNYSIFPWLYICTRKIYKISFNSFKNEGRKINFKFPLKSGIVSRKIYTRAIVAISYSRCNETMLNRLCAYTHSRLGTSTMMRIDALRYRCRDWLKDSKKLASFIDPPLIVHKSRPINYKTNVNFLQH